MKEVKKQRSKNFYFIVFQAIKKGWMPTKICKELGITKQALNYYLSSLKRQGFIQKIGYGTWEIQRDFEEKEVKKTTVVGKNNLGGDEVRGHAFQFKLKLPKIKNWHNREQIFIKKGLKYQDLHIGGVKRGQKLIFKGRKVWITDSSIIIYEKSSYMAKNSEKARKYAIYDFFSLVRGLESLTGASFARGGRYFFKVARQHYSLVKNALAQQYNRENKKLHCYAGNGLWLIIDNSYNLDELETVHPKTAHKDNQPVQDFFNSLKEMRGFTPHFVNQAIMQNAANLNHYAKHLKTHVESVKLLADVVQELKDEVKRLRK
jgi:hypothetical protein